MNLGRDYYRVRRRDKGILCDRDTDLAKRHFGGESFSMEHDRFDGPVVYVNFRIKT